MGSAKKHIIKIITKEAEANNHLSKNDHRTTIMTLKSEKNSHTQKLF